MMSSSDAGMSRLLMFSDGFQDAECSEGKLHGPPSTASGTVIAASVRGGRF